MHPIESLNILTLNIHLHSNFQIKKINGTIKLNGKINEYSTNLLAMKLAFHFHCAPGEISGDPMCNEIIDVYGMYTWSIKFVSEWKMELLRCPSKFNRPVQTSSSLTANLICCCIEPSSNYLRFQDQRAHFNTDAPPPSRKQTSGVNIGVE